MRTTLPRSCASDSGASFVVLSHFVTPVKLGAWPRLGRSEADNDGTASAIGTIAGDCRPLARPVWICLAPADSCGLLIRCRSPRIVALLVRWCSIEAVNDGVLDCNVSAAPNVIATAL